MSVAGRPGERHHTAAALLHMVAMGPYMLPQGAGVRIPLVAPKHLTDVGLVFLMCSHMFEPVT